MGKEYDEHPIHFKELTPKEFAKEFGNTNYFYQRECFKELSREYKKQSKEDKKRGNLSSGLERLSIALYLVVKTIEEVCYICKNYMNNPYKNSK
ncbi:MAG: hypothetical protein ABIE36_00800 [Candidatus Diapherotrites archaeon]